MTRWLIINEGKVVDIVECEGQVNELLLTTPFDTIQDDNNSLFQVGDTFDCNLLQPITSQNEQPIEDFIHLIEQYNEGSS